MANIRKRGRSYEASMDPAYIEALRQAYDYYFFRYTKSPLLIVNTERIDFVAHPEEFEELLRQIMTAEIHGTTYFNPAPAGAPSDGPA